VAAKPHDAVVKFDTRRNTAAPRGPLCDSTALVILISHRQISTFATIIYPASPLSELLKNPLMTPVLMKSRAENVHFHFHGLCHSF